MLVNLTQNDIDKIQIDEGVVVLDFGEANQRVLGPTRGGAELTVTPSIRDIEFDGRKGSTKGMEVKDGEDATLKITTLCSSQENLAAALPGAVVGSGAEKRITPSAVGVIPASAYPKNVTVITKMLDGTFKILKVFNPLHKGAMTFKTASKAENEHNLEFTAHHDVMDDNVNIYEIFESATNPLAALND